MILFLSLVFFILAALGLAFTPLSQKFSVDKKWDQVAGFVFLGVGLIILFWGVFLPNFEAKQEAVAFCQPKSPVMACYNISEAVCTSAYVQYRQECIAEHDHVLKERPSALIGPRVQKCLMKKFDKSLRFNRSADKNEICPGFFQMLELDP